MGQESQSHSQYFTIAKARLCVCFWMYSSVCILTFTYVHLYVPTSFYDFLFVLSFHFICCFLAIVDMLPFSSTHIDRFFFFFRSSCVCWYYFYFFCHESDLSMCERMDWAPKNRNIYGEWSQNECHLIRCCWQHLSLLILARNDFIARSVSSSIEANNFFNITHKKWTRNCA